MFHQRRVKDFLLPEHVVLQSLSLQRWLGCWLQECAVPVRCITGNGGYGSGAGVPIEPEAKWPAHLHDCKAAVRWCEPMLTSWDLSDHIACQETKLVAIWLLCLQAR